MRVEVGIPSTFALSFGHRASHPDGTLPLCSALGVAIEPLAPFYSLTVGLFRHPFFAGLASPFALLCDFVHFPPERTHRNSVFDLCALAQVAVPLLPVGALEFFGWFTGFYLSVPFPAGGTLG